MQQKEKIAKLLEWFVRTALKHAEAMEILDEEAAAAEVRAMDRYYSALRREGGVESFLLLLDHEDASVAGMAAVYAKAEAPLRCRTTLARIAVLPGLIGFRAQAALDLWDERGSQEQIL